MPSELAPRKERRPRDTGDADIADQPVGELGVIVETERADVAEHVVRTLGSVRGEARRVEAADQHIAARSILDREAIVITRPER